ncbi:hypothetical protein [Polyangium fumosum]|uniref:Uncharacterized protein n=1 Tax=Polyangium fumosum TaxID=889272 RepID=A0A4U1IB34_9BACT|nr:hypothetical protein [Polyangium fumosum]TKC90565.1 hypothetical protein E8A74_50880 [Polyangium fumosum]
MSLFGVGCGGSARDVRVLAWVHAQSVAPQSTQEISLPGDLVGASADARVHVARLADGRTCILLKKSIGWKSNFEGGLLCDAPLLPAEIVAAPPASRAYVSLPGHAVFEELYVRTQHDKRTFDVYFDLN